MRVLVDTHCWLWALARPQALDAEAVELLSNGDTDVVFSAVSVWEIAVKAGLGKLRVSLVNGDSLFDIIDRQALTPLPILHSHARQVAGLPHHHSDPFDRLLIAQAQIENLPIMTADGQFLRTRSKSSGRPAESRGEDESRYATPSFPPTFHHCVAIPWPAP